MSIIKKLPQDISLDIKKLPQDILVEIIKKLPQDILVDILNKSIIKFFNKPVTYGKFFKRNDLFRYDKREYTIKLTGQHHSISLLIENGKIYHMHYKTQLNNEYLQYQNNTNKQYMNDTIIALKITKNSDGSVIIDTNDEGYLKRTVILDSSKSSSGGRKAPIVKKEINGILRCIYKIAGSRKEHLKYKGRLITVADYKKLMKKA
jgi:hypothetical protein